MVADPTAPPDVEIIEAGVERLDEIESLWKAMHESDAGAAAEAGASLQFRPVADSWRRRRDEFEHWLREGDSWLLLAVGGGAPVGFAFFRIREGDPGFQAGDLVLPASARGEDQDREPPAFFAQPLDEVDAAEPGQPQVDDGEVHGVLAGLEEAVLAVGRLVDAKAIGLELEREAQPQRCFVLDQQQPHVTWGGPWPRR